MEEAAGAAAAGGASGTEADEAAVPARGAVAVYGLASFDFRSGASVEIGAVYADYCQWCQTEGLELVARNGFGTIMELGHACWPPSPACSLNQNPTDLGIPTDCTRRLEQVAGLFTGGHIPM